MFIIFFSKNWAKMKNIISIEIWFLNTFQSLNFFSDLFVAEDFNDNVFENTSKDMLTSLISIQGI